MMGHREKLKSGDEWDVFTGWRKVLRFRSGVVKKTKRKFWKRVRREEKLKLRKYKK